MNTISLSENTSLESQYPDWPDKGTRVEFSHLVHKLAKVNRGLKVSVEGAVIVLETPRDRPLAIYDIEFEEAFAARGQKLPSLSNYE